MTESNLTEFVRKDLELLGYTCYPEVCYHGGGSARCDLYVVSNDKSKTIAIEAKLSFNLKVLLQAMFWRDKAHEVFILIPMTYKRSKDKTKYREICQSLGIGLMEVDKTKYIISVKPRLCTNPIIPPLYEEQKQVKASNANSSYMTEFKATVQHIDEYMKNKNECTLIELVKNIKHHYKSDMRAMRNIRLYIDTLVIKNYYISKKKNIIVINKK